MNLTDHVAFFDVDGTLLPPPSTERRFLRWLLDRKIIGIGHVFRGGWSLLADVPWSAVKFKANKAYLRGESSDQFHALGAEFVTAIIVPNLRRAARETIERHRRDGDRIILLTGTPDLLAGPLKTALTIDDAICGRLEQVGGRFTGRIIPPHPYGEGKADALRDYSLRSGITLKEAALYGDGWSDLPAFRMTGHPTVINPPIRLARLARRQGWAIAHWPDG
jgi:HAD superfamily hydrolase (TIGR01490 family)